MHTIATGFVITLFAALAFAGSSSAGKASVILTAEVGEGNVVYTLTVSGGSSTTQYQVEQQCEDVNGVVITQQGDPDNPDAYYGVPPYPALVGPGSVTLDPFPIWGHECYGYAFRGGSYKNYLAEVEFYVP